MQAIHGFASAAGLSLQSKRKRGYGRHYFPPQKTAGSILRFYRTTNVLTFNNHHALHSHLFTLNLYAIIYKKKHVSHETNLSYRVIPSQTIKGKCCVYTPNPKLPNHAPCKVLHVIFGGVLYTMLHFDWKLSKLNVTFLSRILFSKPVLVYTCFS